MMRAFYCAGAAFAVAMMCICAVLGKWAYFAALTISLAGDIYAAIEEGRK